MNRLLCRFNELKKFEKRIFKVNGKDFILSLKPLSFEQICFFTNDYQTIIDSVSEKDAIDFFYELFDSDDSEFFYNALNYDEFKVKILEWFFSSYLPFNDFEKHVFEGLTNAYKEANNDLFVFFQELISFGYNYLELSKLTSKELIELCFKELMFRDYDRFLKFSFDLTKKTNSERCFAFLSPLDAKRKAFLEELKKPAAAAKAQSDYDTLESL